MNNQKWNCSQCEERTVLQEDRETLVCSNCGYEEMEYENRASKCYIACQGIQDPAAAIPAMHEALRMALMELIKPCQKQKTIELLEQALKQAGAL